MTDMTVTYNKKTYNVPEGFTVEEFVQSLAAINPKAASAKLIKDGEGKYTLKDTYFQNG